MIRDVYIKGLLSVFRKLTDEELMRVFETPDASIDTICDKYDFEELKIKAMDYIVDNYKKATEGK